MITQKPTAFAACNRPTRLLRAWWGWGVGSALLLQSVLAQGAEAPAQAAETQVRYADVQPLFERYCVDCHSGWFPDGGLRLDSRENIRKGGRSGAAVVPGKPEKGWLMNLVRPVGGNPSKMPPGPARLSDAELDLLVRWIEQGAR